MKKLQLIISLIGCFWFAPSPAQNVNITGYIPKDMNLEGKEVTLMFSGHFVNNPSQVSSPVKDGQYAFNLTIQEPTLIHVETPRYTFYLAVQGGDRITIDGMNIQGASLQETYQKQVGDIWNAYLAGQRTLFNKYKEIVTQAQDKKLGDSIRLTAGFKQYIGELNLWNAQHQQRLTQQIKEYPNSVWPLICLNEHKGSVFPTEEQYALLSDSIKQTSYGKAFRTYLDTRLLGHQAPSFSLKDRNGQEHSLASLLQGKNYLLIDFWASWCNPCRKGIPVMKGLVKQYAKEGIGIVNISIDKDVQAWTKALDEEKMDWINLHDAQGLAKTAYEVKFIPAVMLIKADGTVLFDKLYGEAITMELQRIFGY